MAIVTIVGRPNVGKSSLFNRLIGRRLAIVDDVPGVTRDRLYGEACWQDRRFYVVDTGGIVTGSDEPLMEGIVRQVRLSLEESDAVLFVIDGREGVTPLDQDIAQVLRKSARCPVILVANKADDPRHEDEAQGAYSLGFDHLVAVSAEHRRNIGELMEMVVSLLPPEELPPEELADELRVAIIGRPNVGKSSIFNALAGEERSLVSPIPGTTRDAVDSLVEIDGTSFRFVDTAGLRRRSRISSDVEYYSMLRSYEAIDRCAVAVLVIEGGEPATDQEKRLAGHVLERGRGLVLVVNKWDLAPREESLGDRMRKYLRREFAFVDHAPTAFVSAKTGRGLQKIPQHVLQVYENWRRRIPTGELNRILRDLMAFERLPSDGAGKFLRIYYASQVRTAPPSFAFFVNDPDIVTKGFSRYVEKRLRGVALFDGAPMRLYWRTGERKSAHGAP